MTTREKYHLLKQLNRVVVREQEFPHQMTVKLFKNINQQIETLKMIEIRFAMPTSDTKIVLIQQDAEKDTE